MDFKHALARQCTETKLGALIPGRFSLEQRYRYDSRTGRRKPVSTAEEQALKAQVAGIFLTSVGFPVLVGREVAAVISLHAMDRRRPDPALLEVLAQAKVMARDIAGRRMEYTPALPQHLSE